MKAPPKIGTTGEFCFVVGPEHTITFATDGMPAVLSTPSLIGIFERTAREAIEPFLEAGERSLGVEIELRHLAPTPLGARVTLSGPPTLMPPAWLRGGAPKGVELEPDMDRALDGADAFKEEVARRMGQDVLGHVTLRIARDPEEMARLAPREVPVPRYASGVAYPSLHLVLVTLVEIGRAHV